MDADFFLTTAGEYVPLASPRGCSLRARLTNRVHDNNALVEIEPAFAYCDLSGQSTTLNLLIVTPFLDGDVLFPIRTWPCHVYVARILDEAILQTNFIAPEAVEIIAWGLLFPTLNDANLHAWRNR
jgi:hypothetical protein